MVNNASVTNKLTSVDNAVVNMFVVTLLRRKVLTLNFAGSCRLVVANIVIVITMFDSMLTEHEGGWFLFCGGESTL